MRHAFSILLILATMGVVACASSVPPTVTRRPSVPFHRSEAILVEAARQRPQIVESLEAAGLKPSDRLTEGGYTLTVAVGNRRATGECGTVHNVAYILRLDRQRLVIKGRGATGNCPNNIFDNMSRKLAASMVE